MKTYQITIESEQIALSRLTKYIVAAGTLSKAAERAMKHARKLTSEKLRAIHAEEIAGETIKG